MSVSKVRLWITTAKQRKQLVFVSLNAMHCGTRDASPVAHVAGAVFVGGAARASADPVHVLVAFGGVLGEIDPSTEHAADVRVPLVEAFVDDGVDEGRTCR